MADVPEQHRKRLDEDGCRTDAGEALYGVRLKCCSRQPRELRTTSDCHFESQTGEQYVRAAIFPIAATFSNDLNRLAAPAYPIIPQYDPSATVVTPALQGI